MEVQVLANRRGASGLRLTKKEYGIPAAVVELSPVNRASLRRNSNSGQNPELCDKGPAWRLAASPPKPGELGCGLGAKQNGSWWGGCVARTACMDVSS